MAAQTAQDASAINQSPEQRVDPKPIERPSVDAPADYVLGPGDEVIVRVLDLDEIPDRPFRVDRKGDIDIPLLGEVAARGKTAKLLENELRDRLRAYLHEPRVTVIVTEAREQPVTVLGAVNTPGVKQIHGPKTLMDALSEAGGLRNDAGPVLKITRRADAGEIPLPQARLDPDSGYSVAEVEVSSLLHARNPRENIPLAAHDVVTVPIAEMVYILGEVFRPGGYEVKENKTLSVLDAVALAGGINRNASSSRARVLRHADGTPDRTEYAVDLHRMLDGTEKEFELQPRDILYIPTNKGKVITTRALEAMIGTGSSIAVFRGSR